MPRIARIARIGVFDQNRDGEITKNIIILLHDSTVFFSSFCTELQETFAVFGQNRDGEITKSIIILLHDSTVFFSHLAQNCKRRLLCSVKTETVK